MSMVKQPGFGHIPASKQQLECEIFVRDIGDANYQRSSCALGKAAQRDKDLLPIGEMLECIEAGERCHRSVANHLAGDCFELLNIGEIYLMSLETTLAQIHQTVRC